MECVIYENISGPKMLYPSYIPDISVSYISKWTSLTYIAHICYIQYWPGIIHMYAAYRIHPGDIYFSARDYNRIAVKFDYPRPHPYPTNIPNNQQEPEYTLGEKQT